MTIVRSGLYSKIRGVPLPRARQAAQGGDLFLRAKLERIARPAAIQRSLDPARGVEDVVRRACFEQQGTQLLCTEEAEHDVDGDRTRCR